MRNKIVEEVQKIADDISKNSGIEITVHTVSLEPTSYSNGEFPIEHSRWEEQLIRLFDAYAPERDNSWREYGVDFENETFWVHIDYQHFDCICGYRESDSRWGGICEEDRDKPHKRECEYWWLDKPNFFHKPSGYGVHWYKYPCREAYGNQAKTIGEFQKIIDECIYSLGAKR